MTAARWRVDMRTIRPMLATLEDAPLDDGNLVYEPKYDGIRALVEITPAGRPPVRIWSRLGNDKTGEFPDLVSALERYGKKLKGPVVLDGEVVALDASGDPAGFQRLQNRSGPVAFVAFDILRDGDTDMRPLPLTERRAQLERRFQKTGSPSLRISTLVAGDGRKLHEEALERGWEGLIAKAAQSIYHTGKRTRDWRKLKLVREQEFAVGGWTDARTTGRPFGALLLGYYADGHLEYAGHTGSGFDQRELERVIRLLKPQEIEAPAFRVRPKTNQRPHWTTPSLVAQVKFTEWTDDGLLRHPIYLGLRDDIDAASVRRETSGARSGGQDVKRTRPTRTPAKAASAPPAVRDGGPRPPRGKTPAGLQRLIDRLDEIERGPGSGTLDLPDGQTLEVSNLRKLFWPALKVTKGELMRYYVRVSPCIQPVVDDRPLIMKRFPNGVDGQAFYQQRAPEKVPSGVRVAKIRGDELPSRIVGGNLMTLLYMTQLAAISQDPWFSRRATPEMADQCAIDLDPMPGVTFSAVLDVARWVRDELETLGVQGFAKTSGASGAHIFVPLRAGTPYAAGLIFCQIVATVVAEKHPKVATIERTVRSRGQKVYVDYLQNIGGKSLACAYSARASEFAGASTPLTWKEVDAGVDPHDFTIRTLPDRLDNVGDLWAPLLASKGVDLRTLLKRMPSTKE